jgi:ankyrin repeat protein
MFARTSRGTSRGAILKTGMIILGLSVIGMASMQLATGTDGTDTATGQAAGPAATGRTELMVAAKMGDYERVVALLASGGEVNQENQNGGTALMYSALGGDPRITALLIDRGAEIDAVASNGWGALMIAVAKGHGEIVQLLLTRGADPNRQDIYMWTPLMRAAHEGRLREAEVLLSDPRTEVNRRGEYDSTALHLAAAEGHEELVRLLLRHGASKTLADGSGRTAHTIAAQSQRPEIMKLLED